MVKSLHDNLGTDPMKQYEESEKKLRSDGSIDTAYYLTIGRKKRAEEAHNMVRGMLPKSKLLSLRRWSLVAPFIQ